jgi:hypothetical protein
MRVIALLAALAALAAPDAASAHAEPPGAATATAPSADGPLNFGRKTNWFAVRSADPRAVAHALGLADASAADWATGLAAATARPGTAREPVVFLTPPIDGWVMVVGSSLPYPDHKANRGEIEAQIDQRFDHLFTALAARFDEVQFFGSYRAVGFCAWARARHARIERIFAYADGEVLANVGAPSAEESALTFPDLSGLSPEAARDALLAAAAQRERREEQLMADGLDRKALDEALRALGRAPIPDEDDTLDLAGAWSVNPALLESRDLPPGTGLAATLPADLRQ